MSTTDKSFSSEEIGILAGTKGRRLESVDAVIAARGDMAWETVRLHLSGMDVDVNVRLGMIEVDEMGTLDEFGLMSVSPAPGDELDIPEVGADTTVFPVGEVVRDVRVVNDVIHVYGDGALVATISYPQAIMLGLDTGWLCLDKEIWFSEMIAVKRGDDASKLVYDESVNWEDDEEDPSTHYEFSVEETGI